MTSTCASTSLAALLMLLGGCSVTSENQTENGIVVTGQSTATPVGPAPQETRGQDFVSAVLGGFDFALASARLAAERAEPATVRTYAQKLAADVTAAREELAGIAQASNLKMEPTPGPTHQSDLAVLSSTRGLPLAKAFGEQQMDSLTMLVGTMRAYKNGGDNAQLKAWAEKHQAIINDRLLDVQTLNAELEALPAS